jgi:hypothetical protein
MPLKITLTLMALLIYVYGLNSQGHASRAMQEPAAGHRQMITGHCTP